METPVSTITAPAPTAPPAVPATLAEFRAQRAAEQHPPESLPVEPPPTEHPPAVAVSAPTIHTAIEEPPEPPEEGEGEPSPAEGVKPPEPTPDLRWKDPETGIKLDLRRKDHRRIKRALEQGAEITRERDQLAMRLQQLPAQAQLYPQDQPRQQAHPNVVAVDPNDPEPTLEQFAEDADPYAAHMRALARWDARQESRLQQATYARVERARQAQTAIDQAQQVYDAELPQVRARYPDFDEAHTEVLETVARLPMPARGPLVYRLLTSPVKHDLTHHLGSHPEDLAAVASARSAHEQGIALGAIETRVRALVNQRTSPAPTKPPAPAAAPIAPVGGNASPAVIPDASKMSLAQFRANKKRFGMSA